MTIFFYKGLTRNSEIPSSEICPISGDWGKLGIPNLARISLIKFCWMLQNTRVTAFTISELSRENQRGVKLQILFSYKNSKVSTFEDTEFCYFLLTRQYFYITLYISRAVTSKPINHTIFRNNSKRSFRCA